MTLPSPDSDQTGDLELLRHAAREAGEILRTRFRTPLQTWSKGAAGPVTDVDFAVDNALHDILTGGRPDYGWLSEESADDLTRVNKGRTFVVDPLDGTKAFIKGQTDFCTALAIVEDGRPVLGIVFNPMEDEWFEAAAGQGATLNGRPINVSATRELEHCRMAGDEKLIRAKFWPEPWPAMHIEQRNALAYRLSLVACGLFDASFSLGFKAEWDIAAATIILQEAGGSVTDPWGGAIAFNQPDPRAPGIVASGSALHPLLIQRVRHIPHPSTFPDASQ